MKPVKYLTRKVQESVDSAMHSSLVYNSEDEGDVETNPETLKSHMKTIQAELESLFNLSDCLNQYLEVSAQFMEQLVPELEKHADPQKHPVLCARILNRSNGDSLDGMEQRYKHLQQAFCNLCCEFAKGGTPDDIPLDGWVLLANVGKIVKTLDISANTEIASEQVDDMMPFLSFFEMSLDFRSKSCAK
jgi:hypothetical protein